MSRVIKFRAWDKRTNQMSPVANISFGHDGSALTLMAYLAPTGNYPDAIKGSIVHGESGILIQFTGLLDKNGSEVYEGDILQIENATAQVVFWERPPEFGLNFYHNEDAWCEDWNLTDDSDRMEIIGNIYENPEMVEEEKK